MLIQKIIATILLFPIILIFIIEGNEGRIKPILAFFITFALIGILVLLGFYNV